MYSASEPLYSTSHSDLASLGSDGFLARRRRRRLLMVCLTITGWCLGKLRCTDWCSLEKQKVSIAMSEVLAADLL
jgi:hypothetical protein